MSEVLLWGLVISFLAFGVISYLCKISRFLLRLLEAAIFLAVTGYIIHILMPKEKVPDLKKVEKKIINHINDLRADRSRAKAIPPKTEVDKKTAVSEQKKDIVKSPGPSVSAAPKTSVKHSKVEADNSPAQPARPVRTEQNSIPMENKTKTAPAAKENTPESASPEKKTIKKKTLLIDEIDKMDFDI